MNYPQTLAQAIFEFARACDDRETLTRLSEMAWSLKPIIEQEDSGLLPESGQELWLYIGVKRDANPEMAADYAKRISKYFQ